MPNTSNCRGTDDSRVVADGWERLEEGIRSAVLPKIEADVTAEYAERMTEAGFLRRLWLSWCMAGEIERRVEHELQKQLPSDDTLF